MFNTKIKTISVVVTAALLSACASGGSTAPATIATAPAPVVPATQGTPVTTQPAANTAYAPDAVTLSLPATIAAGEISALTGAATVLGATAFTVSINPTTGVGTSATFAGGVNTSVATLTTQTDGGLAGTAANGQRVVIYSKDSNVPATTASPAAGLTYASFGDWQMNPTAAGAATATFGVYAGGEQFTATMPTTGSATYTGATGGTSLVTAAGTTTPYDFNGNLALTANFAANTVTGNITGITAVNPMGATPVAAGAFNNVALAGTINGNAFSGTATAGAAPAGTNPAAIAAGTTGSTSGHFYGPAANEVTGVWSMSAGGVQTVGSFGAKK